MIAVIGSRYDSVATDLAARWPDAALCSAEDLVRPGWIWRRGGSAGRQWIIDGRRVADEEVSGVFLRRMSIHPEELFTTHPDDRAFLASEAHAFLAFVLASTGARVVNRVEDGTFGQEALRPERWMAAASEAGLAVRPWRMTTKPRRPLRARLRAVEIVDGDAFGDAPQRVIEGSLRMMRTVGAVWGTLLFDGRNRVVTISTVRAPSAPAFEALGRYLGGRRE